MNLFRTNIWLLLRNGTVALPIMLVLSVVFSVLWQQKNLDPSQF